MASYIKVGAYFTSNGGHGSERARIITIDGDTVHMKRWRGRHEFKKGTNVSFFELPISFFFSKSCGWKADESINMRTALR